MRLFALLAAALSLAAAPIVTPPEHRRPPDQTFLTGPEWFLVFSPAEYAAYVRHAPPSGFPFYGHVRQFWQGYRDVTEASARYPVNYGYHVMILVIGISTTIEYGLKGLYETLIGHFSEQLAGVADTSEDRLAASTAQRYVDFIKVHPWYDFDFLTPLKLLWTETGLWGDKPLRKWERKYLLTSEYLAKAVYGWALGKATHASYDRPIERTYVIVDGFAAGPPLPDGVILEQRNTTDALLSLPRYQAFTVAAEALAREGANFREIAGNRDQVLMTVIATDVDISAGSGRLIYSQPILTRPGHTRYAISYSVAGLAAALRRFSTLPVAVEHIYDF